MNVLERPLSATALFLMLMGLVPQLAAGADAFYIRQMELGLRDLELGLPDEARTKLRTACFGFLDEPELLAEGLMQLGRAQAQSGKIDDLADTAERLVEIEDRFGAYSSFQGELKKDFENSLRAGLPETRLARLAIFSHLIPIADSAMESKPQTPKQRRKALERHLLEAPDDAAALLELAELHLSNRKSKPAGQLLDRLLATEPGHQQALCLRAEIGIDRKECAPALAGLRHCPSLTAGDPAVAELLQCLTSAQRFAEAEELVAQLPPERLQVPIIARAARKIVDPVDRDIPDEAARATDSPSESDDSPSERGDSDSALAPTAATPAALEPTPQSAGQGDVRLPVRIGLTLEERIRRIREDISESEFRNQLEDARHNAEELANDYPDSTEAQHLAARIAYLSADWQSAVDFFIRGGRPTNEQPELLFYLAVASYELGNAVDAEAILREALPGLARNPFVDGYIEKILSNPSG